MSDLAKRLRGDLPQKSIDARRVVLLNKNPSCMRLRAILMVGIDLDILIEKVFKAKVPSEQSKFALSHGITFEKALYKNGGAGIIEALVVAGELNPGEYRNLPLHEMDGIDSHDTNRRRAAMKQAAMETRRALRMRAEGHPNAPNIILQPCLPLRLGDGAELAIIRPDVLYAKASAQVYSIGEIKAFAANNHLTDPGNVAGAAAQAGVYGVALEEFMREAGLPEAIIARLRTEAALLLRKPGSMGAVAEMQPILRFIATARRMLERRPRSLQEVADLLGPGETLNKEENIHRLPARFCGGCRSFCPMWAICHGQALRAGAPSVLGNQVEDAIGPVRTTGRALDLMRGAEAMDDIEREVQRRLRSALRELQGVAV